MTHGRPFRTAIWSWSLALAVASVATAAPGAVRDEFTPTMPESISGEEVIRQEQARRAALDGPEAAGERAASRGRYRGLGPRAAAEALLDRHP